LLKRAEDAREDFFENMQDFLDRSGRAPKVVMKVIEALKNRRRKPEKRLDARQNARKLATRLKVWPLFLFLQ
jgi:hypothetical protein